MADYNLNSSRGYSVGQGIVAFIIGVIALVAPAFVVGFFVYFAGFLAILLSIFLIVSGAGVAEYRHYRWALIGLGILGIIIGILVIASPIVFTIVVVYLIAFSLIVIGAGDVITGLTSHETQMNPGLLALPGVFSIIFGGILIFYPLLTTLVVVQVLGVFAIIYGILSIIIGLLYREKHP
ncbi:MAG TPA: DUF308 domain-containing protein [Methanomicrobiales archaeon]|nr:DUF308 domain-containing protein [Methanomicrobiales archaeon]